MIASPAWMINRFDNLVEIQTPNGYKFHFSTVDNVLRMAKELYALNDYYVDNAGQVTMLLDGRFVVHQADKWINSSFTTADDITSYREFGQVLLGIVEEDLNGYSN